MDVWRCDITGNPVGTDTRMIGCACKCQGCKAADEIERLRTDFEAMKTWALDSDDTNDRLRAALKPFASCVSDQNGEWVVVAGMAKPYDYLCAYRALEQRES